jgi:hypothetical protein
MIGLGVVSGSVDTLERDGVHEFIVDSLGLRGAIESFPVFKFHEE